MIKIFMQISKSYIFKRQSEAKDKLNRNTEEFLS